MNKIIKIAPSILSADFANLGAEVRDITNAGADYIHIDVMDGLFVNNLTIGPDIVKSIRRFSTLPFDVHLMVEKPEKFIQPFAESGADIITIHVEATTHLHRAISLIKSFGKKVGISLVPTTHPDILDFILNEIDLVLVMTVNPGFGGQSFIESQLEKIRIINKKIVKLGKNIELQVDGGINSTTAARCIKEGASVLVAGNYIFKNGKDNYQLNISNLRKSVNE